MLHLFEFETTEDGDIEAAPDPVPEPVAEAEPDEVWSLDRDSWEQTQQQLGQVAEALPVLEQLQQLLAQPEPDPYAELDPFADLPSAFQTLEQRILNMVDEKLNPIQETHWAEQGRQIMDESFGSVEQELGTSLDRSLASVLANGMIPKDENGRPALTPDSAKGLFKQAGSLLAEHDKQVAEKAVEAYVASLASRADQPVLPGNGAAAVVPNEEPGSEKDAALHWAAKIRQARESAGVI